MAALFLIVLVVAWVAICLPAATRARQRGPLESTALFKRGLELIGPDHHAEFVRTLGRAPAQESALSRPAAASAAPIRPARRLVVDQGRTLVFVLLGTAALVSGAVALFRGGWELHLAADAVFSIYVAWLLEEKQRRAERRRKVRSLRAARRARATEPLRAAAGER